MYALEKLFAASGRAGTDLVNFSAATGVSAKTLQQYQYAARQVGVSNQEVEGSFRSLQSAMTKTLLGEGAPKGMGRVAELTGINFDDVQRFAKSPELLMQKLQEYAVKENDPGRMQEVLKSFGLNDGMIAAMRRQAFKSGNLNAAPTYSEQEIKQLDKARAGWANLGASIEMSVGRFNAKHGPMLVEEISKIVKAVLNLVEKLIIFAEKVHAFEVLKAVLDSFADSIEFVTAVFGPALGKLADFVQEALKLKGALLGGAAESAGRVAGRAEEVTPERSAAMAAMVAESLRAAWEWSTKLGTAIVDVVAKSQLFQSTITFVESLYNFLKELTIVASQFGSIFLNVLEAVNEKLGIFQTILESLKGNLGLIGTVFSKVLDIGSDKLKDMADNLKTIGGVLPNGAKAGEAVGNALPGAKAERAVGGILGHSAPAAGLKSNLVPFAPRAILPSVPPVQSGGSGKTQNISVQQTLQFEHNGKDDIRKIQQTHQDAVRSSYRQMSAQSQGT